MAYEKGPKLNKAKNLQISIPSSPREDSINKKTEEKVVKEEVKGPVIGNVVHSGS